MDVDALNTAAGLSRIEESTVYQVLDGVVEISIGSDIGGILSTQLKPHSDEAVGGRRLHRMPPLNGTGEGDKADP